MKSPVPQLKERLFLVSWWKAVIMVVWPQGANRVKEAAPLLSTLICLKKLPGLLDLRAAGNILLAVWSTSHHRPAHAKQ